MKNGTFQTHGKRVVERVLKVLITTLGCCAKLETENQLLFCWVLRDFPIHSWDCSLFL